MPPVKNSVLIECENLQNCSHGLFAALRREARNGKAAKNTLLQSLILDDEAVNRNYEIVQNFDDLFSRGLFEHLDNFHEKREICKVFNHILADHKELLALYEEFYPFGSNKVPSLTSITRWHIRKKLLKDDFIVFESSIPVHVYSILNHYRV